jgi:cytochrome bd ubiquinol oxidase subunit I
MDSQAFLLELMRIKFGLMACFHYIFVPLTLGLIFCIAVMETAFVWTRDDTWRLTARFWFRLFALGWLVGIITGYPLRAQLADEWAHYFAAIKTVRELTLPIENGIGPVMLAGLITIGAFGPRLHATARMLIVWSLVIAMVCQAAAILSLNAWMQHPTAAIPGTASAHAISFKEFFLNPVALSKISHVLSAALLCGSTLICAVGILYLKRGEHLSVARLNLRLGLPLGLAATVLAMVTGHVSAEHASRYQPMKFAAFEGLWQREPGAAGLVLFGIPQPALQANRAEVKIPYLVSLLTGHGLSDSPPGIRDLAADQEARIQQSLHMPPAEDPRFAGLQGVRGLYEDELNRSGPTRSQSEVIHQAALRTIPNVPALFGAFRLMIFSALSLLVLYALLLLWEKRSKATWYARTQTLLLWALPLPWCASFAGWVVAEMGRQPWVIYGYMPTLRAAELPDLEQGVFGTLLVVSAYLLLGMLFGALTLRLIRIGPQPVTSTSTSTNTGQVPEAVG